MELNCIRLLKNQDQRQRPCYGLSWWEREKRMGSVRCGFCEEVNTVRLRSKNDTSTKISEMIIQS